MNRIVKRFLSFALGIIMFGVGIITMPEAVYASTDTKAYNWYVMRNSEHTLPKSEGQMAFIEKYSAYYGDKKASEAGDKVIYLTFDAGYENGNVERVLDALKKHNAPGAFFVLENLVVRNPELIKRMSEEGHLICNHTRSHPDMTKYCSIEKFGEQLSSMCKILEENCGVKMSSYYRPPEGKFSEQNLEFAEKLGYKTVFWSFAYADWDNNRQPSEDYAVKKILDNVHPGEIMLLHPTSKTNADILDRVLTCLEKDGYRFASLDELGK